jgi:hypothetical protein
MKVGKGLLKNLRIYLPVDTMQRTQMKEEGLVQRSAMGNKDGDEQTNI